MRRFVPIVFFAVLALLGAKLITIAMHEQQQRIAPADVFRQQAFFTALKPCDVPGLRERELSRSKDSVAYAGEFSRTASVPWVPGKDQTYFYVVSGAAIARIGATSQRISAGDFLTLPAGRPHAISAITPIMRAVYVVERS
jgi:quercetin dioxygenase-like cupin family protein